MLDLNLLPFFLVAASVLIVTPGPDTLFVVAHSLAGGVRAGGIATLGIALGIAVHSLLAALGIAALVAASPMLFEAIKLVGGGYLFYMGVMSLSSAWRDRHAAQSAVATRTPARRILWQAMVTNVLNPKVLIFFLAFLPQFVNARVGPLALQMLCLGLVFAVLGSVYLIAVSVVAGKATQLFRRQRWLARWLEALSGLIFIGLAARMLLDRKSLA